MDRFAAATMFDAPHHLQARKVAVEIAPRALVWMMPHTNLNEGVVKINSLESIHPQPRQLDFITMTSTNALTGLWVN